jgi:hypothetical protein
VQTFRSQRKSAGIVAAQMLLCEYTAKAVFRTHIFNIFSDYGITDDAACKQKAFKAA